MCENYADVPEHIWQEAHRLCDGGKGLKFTQALAAARAKDNRNGFTQTETAEAVPVAWRWRMAADHVWNYQEDRQRIPDAIHEALYAHPDPEAERDRFRPLQQALAVFDKPDEFMTDDKAWFQALGVIDAARAVIANFPGELEEASRG